MLTRTFVHVPTVGYVIEKRLWQCGIGTWQDAMEAERAPDGFSPSRWALVQDTVRSSLGSLQSADHRYFADLLATRDHWRTFPDFRHRVAYVDIETDGLSERHIVTVIGLYDGVRTRSYIAGENLDQFAEDIGQYSLLVTFNGAGFDLPFLRRRFGDIFDQLHVDLRFALSRLGLRGGLKRIEREVGIQRDDDIGDITGEQAVWLWRQHQRGSTEALDLLVRYNQADVENLQFLMERAYEGLWQKAQREEPRQ